MANQIRRKTIELTPELAAHYLNNLFDKQRKLNANYASQLGRDMMEGRWNKDARAFDPLMVSRDGKLMNGQHRCKAVLETGKTIVVDILYDVPEEMFKYLDGSKSRTLQQFVNAKNPTAVAAVAKYANAIERGAHIVSAVHGYVENRHHHTVVAGRLELLEYIDNHVEHLERCTKQAERIYKCFGNAGSKAMFADAIWTISRISGYDNWADVVTFVDDIVADIPSHPAIANGKNLAVKKVVEQLRDRTRVTPEYWISLILAMYKAAGTRKRTISNSDIKEAVPYFDKALGIV